MADRLWALALRALASKKRISILIISTLLSLGAELSIIFFSALSQTERKKISFLNLDFSLFGLAQNQFHCLLLLLYQYFFPVLTTQKSVTRKKKRRNVPVVSQPARKKGHLFQVSRVQFLYGLLQKKSHFSGALFSDFFLYDYLCTEPQLMVAPDKMSVVRLKSSKTKANAIHSIEQKFYCVALPFTPFILFPSTFISFHSANSSKRRKRRRKILDFQCLCLCGELT